MTDQLLTPHEVARRLNVHIATVKGWLRSGKMSGIKAGNLWRIHPEALQRFLHPSDVDDISPTSEARTPAGRTA